MTYPRETMKQAGFKHIGITKGGCHVLEDCTTKQYEILACNKGHAGYAIKYKNTHLEYCHTLKRLDAADLLKRTRA